eukprot:NODE_19307_length_849_cov_5.736842.p1 GENE.NODE_19307_length_849_cov_5.736842~~NODE_19307_length_849_cov_5.736842.p1  ORF type:complete len:243 (+),score=44.31 NODE_19307_length_849_cov_5.736842:91-819(+)
MTAAKECKVLSDVFGVFVQCSLFLACLLTLFIKKKREDSLGIGRTWFTFGLDSSKQLLGAGVCHGLNLICAAVLKNVTSGGDECAWYWVQIIIDTTVGVAIEYFLLKASKCLLDRFLQQHADAFESGNYRDSEGNVIVAKYAKQLVLWFFIVMCMKLMVLVLMLLLADVFYQIASFVLSPFKGHTSVELVMVMIVTPFIMNAVQFWVVDNIIKQPITSAAQRELNAASCEDGNGFPLARETS